ncbi:MAG: M48 family metallopeptidase [Methanobrevibacter sp.]|uniref:M48 family metallopeptidase n=1 Tax=Methanobrevibacter sp. TaxID=66852 RepID=UPI001B402A56|nr:SprT family zinc-dependent metalloprotease [Methanobrevibacter sp.]MBP3790898.1 M48 family metallopeptidase [Methanobrevibacter sp.]
MAKERISIEGITITLYRKNIKNMYLRINPSNGEVKVSAPLFLSDIDIADFVKSRKEWILEKQRLISENKIKAPLKYTNGETHQVWGKDYTLQLIKNDNIKRVIIDEEKSLIYLPVPKRSTIEKRKNILDEFYREELKKAIPQTLDNCVKIVGRKPTSVTVRKMKNWGNCKQDGRITLNLNLAKKNPICLEYVTIHELCHLIEFNHGKKFKKLMDKFCPDWKKIKKILNE